jgi:hypothetical protein
MSTAPRSLRAELKVLTSFTVTEKSALKYFKLKMFLWYEQTKCNLPSKVVQTFSSFPVSRQVEFYIQCNCDTEYLKC